MQKFKLNIAGMTCVNCSNAIKRAVSKIDGVGDVSVNFANGVGEFEIKNDSLKQSIIDKIKKLGYEVAFDIDEFEKKREEHIKFLKIRFIVAGILSCVIMYLEMFVKPNLAINLVMLALAFFILVYSGRTFFIHAFGALSNKNYDMNVLVSLGTASAFLYSLFIVICDIFNLSLKFLPDDFKNVYFSGSGMIITFVLFGKFLEERSKAKASDYLKTLMSLSPKTALLLCLDGQNKEVDVAEVKVGDVVVVKSGYIIPCDGVVIQGGAEIDASMLTGESLPVYKQLGDMVYAGCLNTNGYINVKVNRLSSQGLISQIASLLSDASTKKMPIARLADKISNIFVPSVILVAVITFCVWILCGGGFTYAILSAVCVLIISCPCALGLATPIGIISALARGARGGILIKNPEVIELLKDIKFAVFDKTGTLSKGCIEICVSTLTNAELSLVAGVESLSEHPLSKAVTNYAKQSGVNFKSTNFELKTLAGLGLVAKDETNHVIIGNQKLFEQENISIDTEQKRLLEQAYSRGEGVILCANNSEFLGFLSFRDEIRNEAKEVINSLKSQNIKTIILSGDNQNVVKSVASELGIDEFYANALPDDKFKKISELSQNGKVLFIGDGINDSPSIKQADVGIAMNSGSDIAKAAGDIVLVKNDLRNVLGAIRLGNSAMSVIKGNLFWAFLYNVVCIPLAAGIFYPSFGILLSPVYGAMAMCFSSVAVVLNSLRLRNLK
ncbi:heavy metal translocating P-type ATPase [Campylobacter mucosalis]|uniref:heavy metal translocating P-type ATPase n=1 Tax=Campylobacter mucosalis TaxID=202 RepID=UPI0024B5A6C8|nr:cation-translocating P-type ATPase [Campylobacter mucosalis]